jgi:TPP-dependent pyruvate/acetoin dehydrogenase alpha subunit
MSLEAAQMKTLFRNLVRAFYFDQMMYRRITTGQLVGFYHPGEGAQAPGVAAGTFLRYDGGALQPMSLGLTRTIRYSGVPGNLPNPA